MKSRFINNVIKQRSKSPMGRIMVITGARQVGKTTIAKHCYTDFQYISIEDPLLRSSYANLTAEQWNAYYPKAILDEVQKEPVLIESIKSVYDQFDAARYVLLGSSQLLLMQKVRESLAGRCIIEEIYPLCLPEMLTNDIEQEIVLSMFQQFLTSFSLHPMLPDFKLAPNYAKRKKAYEYYLQYGGYPALVNENFTNADRQLWLDNYIRTYLERDIRDLAEFRNLEPFVKTQKIAALLTGKLINFSSIAKEANISVKTVQRFFQYLEISYQTLTLQPWHRNPLKKLSKSPKLHFLDPGIQRTILQKTGELNGNEFESAIIAELYKQAKAIHFTGSFYHLNTLDGREVDLLFENENGYIAFEIKSTINVTSTDCRHLKNLAPILDKPLLQSFIISNDDQVKTFDNNILALPAAMFLT